MNASCPTCRLSIFEDGSHANDTDADPSNHSTSPAINDNSNNSNNMDGGNSSSNRDIELPHRIISV